jgi:hypothetical protein
MFAETARDDGLVSEVLVERELHEKEDADEEAATLQPRVARRYTVSLNSPPRENAGASDDYGYSSSSMYSTASMRPRNNLPGEGTHVRSLSMLGSGKPLVLDNLMMASGVGESGNDPDDEGADFIRAGSGSVLTHEVTFL